MLGVLDFCMIIAMNRLLRKFRDYIHRKDAKYAEEFFSHLPVSES